MPKVIDIESMHSSIVPLNKLCRRQSDSIGQSVPHICFQLPTINKKTFKGKTHQPGVLTRSSGGGSMTSSTSCTTSSLSSDAVRRMNSVSGSCVYINMYEHREGGCFHTVWMKQELSRTNTLAVHRKCRWKTSQSVRW